MTQRFWELDSPEGTRNLAERDESVDLEQILCPKDPGHMRGGRRITPLSILLRGHPEDFVWTWHSDCLIQEHVLQLFQEAGFTGYSVRPVPARFKRDVGQPVPRLWELRVEGWGGMAPPESGVRKTFDCPFCNLQEYSAPDHPERLINEAQLNGSDFFFVWPLPGHLFITDRVAQLIRRHRLKGAKLVDPTQLTFSTKTVSGGKLSYWLPEPRARELGALLGIY